jgi:hypothetical protein
MSVAYWTAVAALIAGGCSWVYDADDLRGSGDGGVSVDADPEALFVAGLKPAMVLEGEGSAFAVEDEDLVRAIPIVLEGQNMTADTTFRLEGLGFDMEIEDIAVSGDGRFAAFALRVPIRDSGEDAVIAIQLIKGSEGQRPLLQVKGLDALVSEGGSIDTADLDPAYTHVVLSGDVTATGSAPLRIVATAGIEVSGAVRADAGEAPDAGPGGCPGGEVATSADCGDGSGEAGETTGGGGGGGYGTAGGAGAGDGGDPGSETGTPFVVPLPPADGATARGSGGGGGAGVGATGGGSGGIVELTTPAVLKMSAVVSAAGGAAQTHSLCTVGGGGGGGSGGAILLRAGFLVADDGARADAPGGLGTGNAACRGGDGGDGRIRIDAPNQAAVDTAPAAFVGPYPLIASLPPIVAEASLAVDVRGRPSEDYELFVNGEGNTPVGFATDGDGLGTADVTLVPGLNELCVEVAPAADFQFPESKNCVNVAYIEP